MKLTSDSDRQRSPMKSTKTRFAKKLKSIKASDYLKQDRILQVLSAAEGVVELLPKIPNPISQITAGSIRKPPWKLEVSNLLEHEEEASGSSVGDKENVRPPVNRNERDSGDRSEVKPGISSRSDTSTCRTGTGAEFIRPDLNSSSLFDPRLLEAFERAVGYYRRLSERTGETIENGVGNDITFPEITESERRAEAGEEKTENDGNTLPVNTGADGKDGDTLPATVSGEENTGKDDSVLPGVSYSERRAEADTALPDPLLAETENIQKDDNTLPGLSQSERRAGDKEGNTEKDENALPVIISEIESRAAAEEEDDNALPDPLLEFEVRCPPGGENSVVFYTTTLRGIRKTFDDCNKVRFLLDSFKVSYYERDVSMHREYKEELRRMAAANLPVLFVKGRCVGGAQRVLGLHEQGKLRALFVGVPVAGAQLCRRCVGVRFLMCEDCRGSQKVVCEDGRRMECLICNENGLIVCPACS